MALCHVIYSHCTDTPQLVQQLHSRRFGTSQKFAPVGTEYTYGQLHSMYIQGCPVEMGSPKHYNLISHTVTTPPPMLMPTFISLCFHSHQETRSTYLKMFLIFFMISETALSLNLHRSRNLYIDVNSPNTNKINIKIKLIIK
jgi:hypothetical protein